MPNNPTVIRFVFNDGVYSFWSAKIAGRTRRIVYRVKETGEGAWKTPQQRLENLKKEFVELYAPDMIETYGSFNILEPANLVQVVDWFASHKTDLEDYLETQASYGELTPDQEEAFKRFPNYTREEEK